MSGSLFPASDCAHAIARCVHPLFSEVPRQRRTRWFLPGVQPRRRATRGVNVARCQRRPDERVRGLRRRASVPTGTFGDATCVLKSRFGVMRRYVHCPAGHRNDRTGGRRKCAEPGCGLPLRKRTLPKHKEVLRGDTYPLFVKAAEEIHGVTDESCCVCGKPRSQERRHDRDHDHKTAKPRGLACPGNTGCNVLMLPWITAGTARAIHLAKLAALEPDAERWSMIASYLERVEAWYEREAAA